MKTNITRIAALSVCMTMLASCGNVAAPNETESSIATSLSEEELISSGEADLETSSPDSAESQADERVLALIKAHKHGRIYHLAHTLCRRAL